LRGGAFLGWNLAALASLRWTAEGDCPHIRFIPPSSNIDRFPLTVVLLLPVRPLRTRLDTRAKDLRGAPRAKAPGATHARGE